MESNPADFPVEDQFKIVADKAPVLIWMSGTDRLCYFFNAGWLKFTGRTMAQEQGNGWVQSVHPDDLQRYFNTYLAAFELRREFKIEYRLMRYDGFYSRILNSGAPRYTGEGNFSGYIGYCMDVDELLESERLKNNVVNAEILQNEQVLNEELFASNEELTIVNKELSETQAELASLNVLLEKRVATRTKDLEKLNLELTAARDKAEKNEQFFKSIAVNIPKSLIIVMGKDHRFITVEGDLMVKMGYNGSDYAGKHPTEVSPPERYQATKHLYHRMFAGEHFTTERKAASGEDYRVDFVPLKNEKDEIYAGLIIALDITDIKLSEEKNAKLAAIVAGSDDAIISKTLEGVITSWNRAAENLFGYTEAEMIGESILKIIPEDRHDEEPRIIARIKNGERVEHFETKRIGRDKKLLDLSLTISPIKNAQGDITGVSKIARDISEKKKDEVRKSDFIGMVSHELKTPLTSLNAIVQVVELKLKDSPDTFLSGAMGRARLQVKKMSTMINGFLNISRLESGKILIEKHTFNIDELVSEIVAENELIVSSHVFRTELCQQVKVHADRDKVGSVISNLLSNAVKYSPKGKYVDVHCQVIDKVVRISVKDEGMGIKPKDIPKVFDRYFRVETAHTHGISGFGIGLYLSAEIVQRHDGKIWLESESGIGSTFYFTLPLS